MNLTSSQLQRIRHGLTFEAYMSQWLAKNVLSMKGLDKIARRYRFYSKYNLERQQRVDQLWSMSDAFRSAVMSAPGPATWLFITDDWCVDSAYSLPLIRDAVALREDLHLSILLKDDHLDILDHFLSSGARSIPKFIGVGENDEIQFVWGPQPDAIRLIRKELIDSQAPGSEVSGTTVDWYADEGWLEVERELVHVLTSQL
ncbi:MAG: thioredoxin family protein [Bacteroidetes bacterium]|nr:thioredoxin family protein [Bacteroidota bacterium]MDA1333946.1 thioredoxin family protein [Bacteroidota bacterium]